MRVICVFMLLIVFESLANQNFNTDTRLVIHPDDLIVVLLPNGGWLETVDLLKQINERKISDLIKSHKDLIIDNTRLAHRLITSVVRHSMCRMLDSQFQKAALDIIEKATKIKLDLFLKRLSSYDTSSSLKVEPKGTSSTNVIEKNILTPEIIERIKANEPQLSPELDELKNHNYVKEIAESIIVNKELEYIDFATSDSRISGFLSKLYSFMDEDGGHTAENNIINIKIEQLQLRASNELRLPDYGVLKQLLLNTEIDEVITRYAEFFKNRETSVFLQFTVVRHCKLHYLIKKLESTEGTLVILQKAQDLKLKNVKEKIEKIIGGTYLPSDSLEGTIPETGIDLCNDEIFSSLWGEKSFSKLGNDQIRRMEDVISMWIDEKVQLAIVRSEFDNFFKKIFEIIDKGNADLVVKALVRQVEYIRY